MLNFWTLIVNWTATQTGVIILKLHVWNTHECQKIFYEAWETWRCQNKKLLRDWGSNWFLNTCLRTETFILFYHGFLLWNFAVLLDELEQLLKGIAMMKELTLRTRDYLVSFGECMSTRIFVAYLNKVGYKARQVLWIMSFILKIEHLWSHINNICVPQVFQLLWKNILGCPSG